MTETTTPDPEDTPGRRYRGSVRNSVIIPLVDHSACSDGKEWVKRQGSVSAFQLWRFCRRGDWMLWWLRETRPLPNPESPAEIAHYNAFRAFTVNTCLPDGETVEYAWSIVNTYHHRGEGNLLGLADWLFSRTELVQPAVSPRKLFTLASGIRRRFKLEWSEAEHTYLPVPILGQPAHG